MRQELGVEIDDLTLVLPDFRYRAVDDGGVVENEICPVWVGRIDPAGVYPDPDEIAACEWVPWPDLVRSVTATPRAFSPWAALQVPQLAPLIDERGTPVIERGACEPLPDEAATAAFGGNPVEILTVRSTSLSSAQTALLDQAGALLAASTAALVAVKCRLLPPVLARE